MGRFVLKHPQTDEVLAVLDNNFLGTLKTIFILTFMVSMNIVLVIRSMCQLHRVLCALGHCLVL